MREELLILHTNDIHSHLEHWPKIRRFIKTKQYQATQAGLQNFAFDIGDALDRQHPLTEATYGQANIRLMNEIGYSAVTVGNNELLGLNHDQMNHLYDEANFLVVLDNVRDAKTNLTPEWAKPYCLLTTQAGHTIAVCGLTAPFTRTLPLLDWVPESAMAALARMLPEMQQKADTIILLSHLGLAADRQIAEQFPQINLILGAHTHHVLPEGEWHGRTLLAAAGRYGDYVGSVRLTLENGKMVAGQAEVTQTVNLPELSGDAKDIDDWQQAGVNALKQQVLADLPQMYSAQLDQPNRLIDLGLTALESYFDSDMALLSSGMFLSDLPAGKMTKQDLHKILPHAVHPMCLTITGRELVRLLLEIKKNQPFLMDYKIKGMGFRGDQQATFGKMVWSHLEIDNQQQVWVQNQPLEPNREYTIATLDHYLFIPFFPTIEIAGHANMDYDVVLREMLAQYLQKNF